MTIVLSAAGRTAQQVIDSARLTLNDRDAQPRYSDDDMLAFIVDALNAAKQARPDLFLGQFGDDIVSIEATDAIPISAQYFRPIVDYVIGRCEMTDDDYATNGRAELMVKLAAGFMQ